MSDTIEDAAAASPHPLPACAVVEVSALYRGSVIQSRCLHRPKDRFLIGAGPAVDAPAPVSDPQLSRHVLVEGRGGVFLVHVQGGMTGEVTRQGRPVPLATVVDDHDQSFVFRAGDRLSLRLGEMTFVITDGGAAPGPRTLAAGWLSGWRWREQKYTVATGGVLALLLLAIFLIPPDPRALVLARYGDDVRFLAFRVIPPELTPAAGPRSPGRDGKYGPHLPPPAIRPGDRRQPRGDRPPRRPRTAPASEDPLPATFRFNQQRTAIRSAGVLGIFAPASDSPLQAVLGTGSALGSDPAGALAGLTQGRGASDSGVGGLAMNGTGAGPNLGTIGGCAVSRLCSGGKLGRDYGRGGSGLPGRRQSHQVFIPGQPTVRGGLDRETVRRVVRLHLNEIRYCYERELAARPDLTGRAVLNFTIAGDGRVAAALLESSTLGHPRAERCLVEAVRRWTFPQPAGAGLVIATYPFTFTAAGR